MDQITDTAAFGQQLAALPAELLSVIFAALPTAHLKVLSILCQKFVAPAQETLFKVIGFGPRKQLLEAFANVANHNVLSRYVTDFAYDLSRYHRPLGKGQYEKLVGLKRKEAYEPEQINNRYARYIELQRDQYAIIRHDREAEVLAYNLPKLPGLRHIIVEHRDRGSSSDWDMYEPVGQYIKEESRPFQADQDVPLRLIFRAMKTARMSIESFCLRPNLVWSEYDWDDWDCMFRGRDFFLIRSKRQLQLAQGFFCNLTRVEIILHDAHRLRIREREGSYTPFMESVAQQPIHLLRSAKRLRHLKLGFESPNVKMHHIAIEDQVGENAYWPELISLTLDTMHLYCNELTGFIGRHHGSLKEVSLRKIALIPGSLPEALRYPKC
ncbi:hypothetical protein MMC24_007157 [Lignoscripta atroalba]|nr:hypothetical protein [Lignoscripta atroalba]